MITIKKASELTGVPEHTLRAWERRYQVIAPTRTASGYRVYDESSLTRIQLMQSLVQAGWPARQAAAESARRGTPDGTDSVDRLVRAATGLDADAVSRILDEEFSRASFEMVVDDWLMPALTRLGQAWSHGELSVAGEHLVSSGVMRRLAAAYEAAARNTRGATVLIGAPPGVDHELGLLAVATAARRAGVSTLYLGPRVPGEAWREAAAATGARAAVTALHRRKDAARLAQIAEALSSLGEVRLWAGGRYQDLAPAPFRPLGHSITGAAAILAES